jgi:hypothetical protein
LAVTGTIRFRTGIEIEIIRHLTENSPLNGTPRPPRHLPVFSGAVCLPVVFRAAPA